MPVTCETDATEARAAAAGIITAGGEGATAAVSASCGEGRSLTLKACLGCLDAPVDHDCAVAIDPTAAVEGKAAAEPLQP